MLEYHCPHNYLIDLRTRIVAFETVCHQELSQGREVSEDLKLVFLKLGYEHERGSSENLKFKILSNILSFP